MIKISRYNQIYKESPSPTDPWRFHVSLLSRDDIKDVYNENKTMIKSWVSFAVELMVKLDEPGVCFGTTFWTNGSEEFSFNYTLTKLGQDLLRKELITPTIKWKWITNETINETVFGSKNLVEHKNKQTISLNQRRIEEKKLEITKRTKAHYDHDRLRGFGICPMRWLCLDDLKKVTLKKTSTKVVDLGQVIKILTKRNTAKEMIYSSLFISRFIMKIRKHKYIRWKRIIIKVRAFVKLRKFLLYGFSIHGGVLYHKPTNTQYAVAGTVLPSHLERLNKAVKNNQLQKGEIIKIHQNSYGSKYYKGDQELKFSKYKNYKKPRVKIKKADGTEIDSVYSIDQKILTSISKITSQFRKAKKPIDLNRRSKFAENIIKNCHIIYKSMDQVRQPIEFMNVCWRFLDVITIIRDVLFEFNLDR